MANTCSHVLIWVRDLHRAVLDYRALGFEVDFASDERRAIHAHVWFETGPILELLTTPRNAAWYKWPLELFFGRGAGRRMTRWPTGGEGFCDVALVTDAATLSEAIADLEAAGIRFGRVIPWRRTKPNGESVDFAFSYPRVDTLPFLVAPYVPSQHPARIDHPNGATRLARVHMGCRPEEATALRLLVGQDPTFVVQPASETSVLAVELGGLMKELDPALLHGALLRPWTCPEPTKAGDP